MNHPDGQIAIGCMDVHSIKRQFVLPNLKNSIENHLTIIVAWIFALVFLSIALAHGFSMKLIFGNSGMLISANVAKNIFDFVYLVTAICVVTVTLFGEKESVKFMKVVGKIYLLAALIGFFNYNSHNYSEWVSITNFGLGAALAAAGSVLQDYRHKLLVIRLTAKQRYHGNCVILDTIKKSNLKYVMNKRYNDATGKICYREDISETCCIKGAFI